MTIVSNPSILYEIGKISAKSCKKSDMGLLCLKDFVSILKFQNNYELENENIIKKYMAYFYMGAIYSFLRQYKYILFFIFRNAKETFEKIKNVSLIENKVNKLNFIRVFYDFYKKYQTNYKEHFNFDLNKKYLL